MRGESKARGLAAKEHLIPLLPKGVFRLKSCGFDKYSRLLVTFDVAEGRSLARAMIDAGRGYEHHGATKRTDDGVSVGAPETSSILTAS